MEECAQLCDDYGPGCFGFEYGVDYGQSSYEAQDCVLSSAATLASSCNGHNLDFYTKSSSAGKSLRLLRLLLFHEA